MKTYSTSIKQKKKSQKEYYISIFINCLQQTKQREQENSLGLSNKAQSSTYLNFLEKQVDKSNKAFQDMSIVQDCVKEIGQRLDLIELGQTDLIKKFRILESVSMGNSDEQTFFKKTIEQIYLKVQDIEARVFHPIEEQSKNDVSILNRNNQQENQIAQLTHKLDSNLAHLEQKLSSLLLSPNNPDLETFLTERDQQLEQRIMGQIDSQARDIAMDFTSLEQRIQEIQGQIGEIYSQKMMYTQQTDANNYDQTSQLKASSLSVERSFLEIKREISGKVELRDVEQFKNFILREIKDMEKQIKDIKKPQQSFDKDLKALENRLTLKLSKAIQKIGEIIKKQDRKLRGVTTEINETRLQRKQATYSPMSNKSRPLRSNKSQHSLNISNTSMMKSLSPIKQTEDSRVMERSAKSFKQNDNEYQSINTNESAFRRYQSQFKSDQQTSNRKYIHSGNKQAKRENSNSSLSPNNQFKRTLSQKKDNAINIENYQKREQINSQVSVNREKAKPIRKSSKEKIQQKSQRVSIKEDPKKKSQISKSKEHKTKSIQHSSKHQTLNVKSSVNEFDTPNFDLKTQSPETFRDEQSIRERYLDNLRDYSTNSRQQIDLQASGMSPQRNEEFASSQNPNNQTLDKSMQLRITNERLAKLEKMYEELSQLEDQAKQNR